MKKSESQLRVISLTLVLVLLVNVITPSVYAMNDFLAIKYGSDTMKSYYLPLEKEITSTNNLSSLEDMDPISESVTKVLSGPGQAESSGFSIGTTDGMVNKFTGDFSYSIPLLSADGYPIVLSYNSNVAMLSESSWVGLGWDLNLGAIARDMRGIPDDFNGDDEIIRYYNQKENLVDGNKRGTYLGMSFGKAKSNFAGGFQLTAIFGKYTDNYLGKGQTIDLGLGGQFSVKSKAEDGGLFITPSVNLGFNYDSNGGIGTSTNMGLSGGYGKKTGVQGAGNISYGRSYNSRYGLSHQSLSAGVSAGYIKNFPKDIKDDDGIVTRTFNRFLGSDGNIGSTSTITYGTATSVPRVQFDTDGGSHNFEFNTYVKIKLATMSIKMGSIKQDYSTNSEVRLDSEDKIVQPAFGYFHSGKRANYQAPTDTYRYPVMDYNRGIDNEFSEEMNSLPFSIQTHDIFYVNGYGIQGTYRPQRTDYGAYYDPETESLFNAESELLIDDNQKNLSTGVILDFSGTQNGIGFGLGYSTGTMKAEVHSGGWNSANNLLSFNSESATIGQNRDFDKSIYFRSVGENTPVDMSAWNYMSGNSSNSFTTGVSSNLVTISNILSNGSTVSNTTLNSSTTETYSANYFHPNTVKDLQLIDPDFKYFNEQTGVWTTRQRNNGIRKMNHLSSIDVVNSGGLRYYYGIPAYEYFTDEVSFASEGLTSLTGSNFGLVEYNPGVDDSKNNGLGRSNYYEKTRVPAFAHSFLLTQMVSSDYIDRTDDGPTLDDVGNYYKIDYTQVYGNEGTANTYKWRFPISGKAGQENTKAFSSEGVQGSELDNIANYSYGEKEIWYAKSIESKNIIVEFVLGDREDMYSVLDEKGYLDVLKPLKYLSEIVVYNRSERLQNPNAEPIQRIVFDYDYSLCPNSPGNLNTYLNPTAQTGKLTLIGIRVFSGNSNEMALSKTEFIYASGAQNPDFTYAGNDAWNCYKANNGVKPNNLYPYATQDATAANNNASAWKLVAINNPQGGRVEIDYESDSYGYVQDKRAMRHFDIYRMTNVFDLIKLQNNSTWDGVHSADGNNMTTDFHTNYSDIDDMMSPININNTQRSQIDNSIFQKDGNAIYTKKFGALDINAIPNNVIIFKLESPINGSLPLSDVNSKIKEDYFLEPTQSDGLMKKLFLNVHAVVKQDENETSLVEDYIPVMVDISSDYLSDPFNGSFNSLITNSTFERFGVMPKNSTTNKYEYAYVVVDPVNTGKRDDTDNDKVKKGAFVISPIQLSVLEFARQNLVDKVYGLCEDCESDMSIDWKVFFGNNIYEYMVKEAWYAPRFVEGKSIVRLYEPDYEKLGGGARVKEIRYFDNWNTQSGETSSTYTWRYAYGKSLDPTKTSGVASFEGMGAIDESPFYEWKTYKNIKKKFPDENKFVPGPVAYQLYPTPMVGYQNVEVTFVNGLSYGKSKSNYYTSRDFPTKFYSSVLDKSAKVAKKNIITGVVKNYYGLSQGYLVETNDFHGKPKSDIIEDGVGNIISKSVYTYNELNEKIQMADRSGYIQDYSVATEYDIHLDSRYISDVNNYKQVGLDFSLLYLPPASISIKLSPDFATSKRERAFYSNTLVKHINYSAVLKNIQTEYLGSTNEAKTMVYDKFSGGPILSVLKDEFNDELYSLSYPSHWKYRELRDLNSTKNAVISVSVNSDGEFIPIPGTSSDLLSPGDFISINGQEVYVAKGWPWPLDNSLFFIDLNGVKIIPSGVPNSFNVTLIKSNRDNRLGESMQNFVTKVSPISVDHLVIPINEIISSTAITYRDRLNAVCGEICGHGEENNNAITPEQAYNPYIYGMRGDLVLDRQFNWQSERRSNDANGVRFNGVYETFAPFYDGDGLGNWYGINVEEHSYYDMNDAFQKWRPMGIVTTFDQFGNVLEGKDQINVHSSVLMGYNSSYNLVPTASAVNAKQEQIAFDGFEDYGYYANEIVKCQVPESHFDFYDVVAEPGNGVSIDNLERHSGLFSLKLDPSTSAVKTKDISNSTCYGFEGYDNRRDDTLTLKTCACILPFAPSPGKYIIGAWVKSNSNYSDALIRISADGNQLGTDLIATGPILDGWQRIEGVFTIPTNGTQLQIALWNEGTEDAVYFDDLRIHPFLAGMSTVVYNPKNLLPLASHDGYNFTTFYNYDENLNLVRIRVETVDGIKTISESEMGGQKLFIGQ